MLSEFPCAGRTSRHIDPDKRTQYCPDTRSLELDRVWTWMDSNPELVVGIFTGSGRAFCTGADLRGK